MSYESGSTAVHVIDDDESFRISMQRLLSSAGFRPLSYSCVGEFLLAGVGEIEGCVLLDIVMPGPSGIDLLTTLIRGELPPPVIFMTGRDDISTSVHVMKSGAFDYLVKPVSPEKTLAVVRRALQVDAKRRREHRELDELRRRLNTLTSSERAIFHGILCNRLNKQLAADFGACERTIKGLRAEMMRKLQVSTLPELVRAAWLLEGGTHRAGAVQDEVNIAQRTQLQQA
jgi:FixJ family two-component response regulator